MKWNAKTQLLNVKNGIELRVYYEALRGWLTTERSTWDGQYQQLARFILPRHQRFNYTQSDVGFRADQAIVDNTATIAIRTLRAGLTAGICSPTRTWFNLETGDEALDESKAVKMWLEEVEEILRNEMLRSNFYQTMHNAFGELGLYGTTCFEIKEHYGEDGKDDGFRCYPWPVGSYYIAGDECNRIDLRMRVVQMTVRQMVQEFGFENCSSAMQTLYVSNAGGIKEQWYPVVHVVHRNTYFGGLDLLPDHKPWVSVWYEMGNYGNDKQNTEKYGLLRKSGFWECPIITARWDVIGEDFYGVSPGMDALGDTMGLQLAQKRKQEAIDKMVKPPMVASPTMINSKMSLLPGDVTYADLKDGAHGFRPAFEMRFDVADAIADIQDHHRRINAAFYVDLFLMLANSDRREVTAEEIRAKQEEKMLVLGPVLERSNDELLTPAIFRMLAILGRQGKLPPPPESVKNKKITVRFQSILAQAQRMLGVANIDRFMVAIGQEAAVNQGVFDTVDLDETVRQYADLLHIPASIMREPKEVQKIRADKMKAQQQAMQAENAQKMAMAAKNLAGADTAGQNGLTDLLRNTTGF